MATQPDLKIQYIKCIHINEYKQLQWINPKFCHERWCRPIGSYSIWYNDIIIHMAQLIGYFRVNSQLTCCSTFKYSASACCSSCTALQKPSTFYQLHLYRSATRIFNMLYVQQQYFLHAHRSISVDVLEVYNYVHFHTKVSESCQDITLLILINSYLY